MWAIVYVRAIYLAWSEKERSVPCPKRFTDLAQVGWASERGGVDGNLLGVRVLFMSERTYRGRQGGRGGDTKRARRIGCAIRDASRSIARLAG